ncbi:MAG: DUF1573 domain-containing protein [Patescibacteria group bacterium]
MKNVIGIFAAILVLAGLVYIARPSGAGDTQKREESDTSSSVLLAEETSYDFEEVSMAKGNVSHSFKVKNVSTSPVTIEKMYTSCMCTTAKLTMGGKVWGPYGMPGHMAIPKIGEALGAGEEAVIETVFDPAAHGPAGVGRIERQVTIENSAGEPVELKFVAVVVP